MRRGKAGSATFLGQFGASLEAKRSSDATSPHWPPMWRRRWASGLSSAAQCGVPGTSKEDEPGDVDERSNGDGIRG